MLNDAFRRRMPHFLVAAAARKPTSTTLSQHNNRSDTRTRKPWLKLSWLQQKSSQLKSRLSTTATAVHQKRRKGSNDSSVSTTSSTLDWRSLSPDRPPLPIFLTETTFRQQGTQLQQKHAKDNRKTHSSFLRHLFPSSLSTSSSTATKASHHSSPSLASSLLQNTTLQIPADTTKSSNRNRGSNLGNDTNAHDKTFSHKRNSDNPLPLCPILEESEMMGTESATTTSSNVVHSNSHTSDNNASRIEKHVDQAFIKENASSTTPSIPVEVALDKNVIEHVDRPQEEYHRHSSTPSTSSSLTNTSGTTTRSSSFGDYDLAENAIVAKILQDDYTQQQRHAKIDDDSSSIDKTEEEKCKRKFAKMVLAAIRFNSQDTTKKGVSRSKAQYLSLLFDPVSGNIDKMRVVVNGRVEYHQFCGNAQYLPPELSKSTLSAATKEDKYNNTKKDGYYCNNEMMDVWVLGIFLYRLLTKRYPFMASNDLQLFGQMLQGDFKIPDCLSDECRDIIKRMLLPESTRASLDAIIHHPWLANYRQRLVEQYQQPHQDEAANKKSYTSAYHNELKNVDSTTASRPPSSSHTHSAIAPKKHAKPTLVPLNEKNSIKRLNSVGATTATTPYSNDTSLHRKKQPLHHHITYKKRDHKKDTSVKKAFSFVFQGPFPPPKRFYQDLSHLGTRKSAFLKC